MGAWKTTVIALTTAFAGGAAALWFSPLRPMSLKAGAPALAAATQPARDDEMAALKTRLALLETRSLASTANSPSPPAPASSRAHEDDDRRSPEVIERERKVARWMDDHYTTEVQGRVFGRYFAEVDQARLAERRDAAWGDSVGRDLQKLFDETPGFGGTRVERLECGGTLCRLHVDVEDPKRRNKLLHAIQSKLHFDEASAFIPGNEHKMQAYLARQGATLPFFDQIKYVEEEMD